MELERSRGSATGYAALSVVASPDEPRDGHRDVLRGAHRDRRVERADVLRVAFGALDARRVDGDRGARAVLPALSAAAAHGHGELELRARTRLAFALRLQRARDQRADELAVIQVPAILVVHRRGRLAKQRVRGRRELEPRDVGPQVGVRRILGIVAGTSPYHDLGDAYLDNVDHTRTAKNLVRRLERLGFAVDLKTTKSQENASAFS